METIKRTEYKKLFKEDNAIVIKKEDLVSYLMDCENEYKNPDQEYRNKDTMPEIYSKHATKVSMLEEDYLFFNIY